jgi:hypothetical protein
MSKKIEERNLEQAVVRKTALRNRTTRAKVSDSGGMAKPKRMSRPTTQPKSVGKRRVVKTKPAAKKIGPAQETIQLAEIIPITESKLQDQDLLPGISVSAGLEPIPDLSAIGSQDMSCTTVVPVPDDACEENECVLQEQDLEAPTGLTAMQQSTDRKTILTWMVQTWNWARKHLGSRQSRKRLRVCETVSLGEKRFVAVIEVDGEQFLVGGASSSVATLARLEPSQEFADVLRRRWAQEPMQA